MKNYVLFLIDFLFFPLISWIFTFSQFTPGGSSIPDIVYTFLTLFCSLFYFFFFYTALRKAADELLLIRRVDDLRESRLLQERQDRELSYLKERSEQEKADFTARLKTLDELISRGDYSAARAQIEMVSKAPAGGRPPVCGDPFLSLLLQMKESEAAEKGISVSYSVDLPPHFPGSGFTYPELSSLFINLLDNAIESCSAADCRKPFLTLKITWRLDFLRIHLVNSKDPVVQFNGSTTKDDPLSHGLGLKIIEEIAENHQGFCRWMDKGTSFEALLIMDYTQKEAPL